MKNKKFTVFCRTVAKGIQADYLRGSDREYYLFTQNYRKSNKEFFGKGVIVDAALNHSLSSSTSVRKTMTKLVPYIEYVEKEYGLIVLRKTQKSKSCNKRRLPYNRQQYKSNQFASAIA